MYTLTQKPKHLDPVIVITVKKNLNASSAKVNIEHYCEGH